jgi:hypothetical protein
VTSIDRALPVRGWLYTTRAFQRTERDRNDLLRLIQYRIGFHEHGSLNNRAQALVRSVVLMTLSSPTEFYPIFHDYLLPTWTTVWCAPFSSKGVSTATDDWFAAVF